MTEVVDMGVTNIRVGDRHRKLDEAAVGRLAQSISEIGLKTPITVRFEGMDGWLLVAGHHRLEAVKKLGWDKIPCLQTYGASDIDTELWEIDENLIREGLTVVEEAAHLARRKELWEQRQIISEPQVPKLSAGRREGFATSASRATGKSKNHINRRIKVAKAIGRANLDMIKGTSLDSGPELEALAKLPKRQREQLVRKAFQKEDVSARAVLEAPPIDPVQRDIDVVMAAWNRACPEARDRVRELIG